MTINTNEHLTVKEAAALFKKSESTIKRLVRDNKGKKKYFKYEKLPTGHKKIYISKAFLELTFNAQKTTPKDKSEPLSKNTKGAANQQFVDYLMEEIERKNEELQKKDERIQELQSEQQNTVNNLMELQRNSQELQAMQLKNSEPKQIEQDTTKPRRGWFGRRK